MYKVVRRLHETQKCNVPLGCFFKTVFILGGQIVVFLQQVPESSNRTFTCHCSQSGLTYPVTQQELQTQKRKKNPEIEESLKEKKNQKKERKRKHLTFSSVLEGEGLPSGMDAALKWTIVDKLITMKAKMGEI